MKLDFYTTKSYTYIVMLLLERESKVTHELMRYPLKG